MSGESQVAAWVAYHAFVVLFLSFAAVVILRELFQQKVILCDHVLGAVCGYLLASVAWGNLYLLAEFLLPGSFSVNEGIAWQLADEHRRRFLFNYFSFTTLTALGYGDITPIGPVDCSLTWTEAVFGQFYLAVIVARLVGLRLTRAMNQADPESK